MKPPLPRSSSIAQVLLGLGLMVSSLAIRLPRPPECDDAAERIATTAAKDPPARTARARPLTVVDYGPCTSLDEDPRSTPTCVFDHEREFRLWLPPEQIEDIEVFVDGERVDPTPLDPVDDRSRGVAIRAHKGTTRIELGLGASGERFVLPMRSRASVKPHERPGRAGSIEGHLAGLYKAAYAYSREHRFDGASKVLALAEPLVRNSPQRRASLDFHRGSLEWRWGMLDDALTSMRAASLHAVRTGEVKIGVAALPMYATVLAEQGYFAAALHWATIGLELAREWARQHGDPHTLGSTLRTTAWVHMLVRQGGWTSLDPTPMLDEALSIFGPHGKSPDPDRTGAARASLARLELQAGRPGTALQILRKIDHSRMTPDEWVLAADVKLQALLARGNRGTTIDRALKSLQQAVEDSGSIDAPWHLALREGQVLEARGKLEAATAAYRNAEVHLDDITQLAAFGVGRSAVGWSHRESSERLVNALISRKNTEDALCVARQAEARRIAAARSGPAWIPEAARVKREHLRDAVRTAQIELDYRLQVRRDAPLDGLEDARNGVAQQQQKLDDAIAELLREVGRSARTPSCEELYQPAPNELLLGLFPRGDGGLVVFANDDQQTTQQTVKHEPLDLSDPIPRASLGSLLLPPAQLERAKRIRVHAVGQAQYIDVDQLPWEGKPLIASKSVVWGIDAVAPRVSTRGGEAEGPRAVLLADPTGSLAQADEEIRESAELLESIGWLVEPIAREDARPQVVLERMANASLLHLSLIHI